MENQKMTEKITLDLNGMDKIVVNSTDNGKYELCSADGKLLCSVSSLQPMLSL